MARKLNSHEAQIFTGTASTDGQSLVEEAEQVLRSLAERRDAELELSPESGMWFGDMFPHH